MKTTAFPALLLVLALALGATGCGDKAPEVRPVGADVSCETLTLERETLPVSVTAVASVEPETRVHVSTRMMGRISALHVREGDVVNKGQRLLTVDAADLMAKRDQVEAGIREAKAVVANAEAMAARFENLLAAKAVSKSQYDDVMTGLERARAGQAQAEAARAELDVHLSYLDIRSPADGVVTRRMVEVGDMAAPGHPLLFVDVLDSMKIVARLGEKDVGAVSAGDRARIEVSSLDDATNSVEVARVIPSANPGSHTYDVEFLVDNPDGHLRPGMFARAVFTVGTREGVLIPRSAVIERGQLTGVFTVDADGLAQLRWIRLGDVVGDRVEVVTGLRGDETLILSSAQPLAEGDRVVR